MKYYEVILIPKNLVAVISVFSVVKNTYLVLLRLLPCLSYFTDLK